MEIVKLDPRFAPNLDKDEAQFIQAKFSPNIKTLSISDFKKFYLILIGKTHLATSQVVNQQNVDLTIDDLCDTSLKYFSTLTVSDIELAFKLGLMNEFGDYFGLNNKTYFQFLKGYLGHQKRLEANRKQGAWINAQNAPKALTDEEKKEIMIKACLDAFEQVKSGIYFNDMGNSIYNFIDRNWKIPIGLPRKIKFIQEAKKKLRENLTDQMLSCTEIQRNAIKYRIKMMEEEHTEEMKVEAKKIALNAYFNDLIELGQELKTIIE